MDRKEIRTRVLDELRTIVIETLSDESVKVYLFGSWARMEEKQTSDIDIAIESMEPIPQKKWLELRDRVEESTIPYKVDIVDLDTASGSLIGNVKREGIVWIDCKND